MVAQQCDLNMLNMVTFISNVMALYCLLFWRLPISLSEIYQCLPWPTWPCIIYIHAITAAITLPSLIYLLCSSYTGLAIKLSSYAFGCVCVCVCVHSVAQSCRTLCNIKGCSPPGSSVHGISQTRTLEWVAVSSSRGFPQSMDQTQVSCIGKWILYHWAIWEAHSLL